jgi:hypothetical protein
MEQTVPSWLVSQPDIPNSGLKDIDTYNFYRFDADYGEEHGFLPIDYNSAGA